jgi:hypothetical protein
MRNIIIVLSLIASFFLGACGGGVNEEPKKDKHAEVLETYNKQVEEYNKSVQEVCDCLIEKGSVQACRSKYNALKFTFTPDMDKYLTEEEFNPIMIEEGNAKIDLCEAEIESE